MALSPSVSRLLTRVESFRPAAGADLHARARGRLALLLAADDDDVLAALGQRSWLWDDVLLGARVHSPDADLARVERWLDGALRDLLGPAPIHRARPLLEALGQRGASGLIPRLAVYLREPVQRRRAARLLADLDLADAWRLLRDHDGPDLDPEVRLGASLRDPARLRPTLVALLGPDADRALRARMVASLLGLPGSLLAADDVLALLGRCLLDGIEPESILGRWATLDEAPARRRLFDLLWPLARDGKPPPGCRDHTLYGALVQTAPAPDLLAILLDTLEPSTSLWLAWAIRDRPDPHLVPALERWLRACKSERDQDFVAEIVARCRGASPWGD